MTDTGLTASDIGLIVAAISACEHVDEVLIFGSRAKGTHKPGSDVDLALKGDNLTYDDLLGLSAELNEYQPLPYMFDLVDYSHLDNPRLKAHIDRVGVLLFSREVQ